MRARGLRGSALIWWGLVALVVGAVTLLWRGGDGKGPERGTISGQWLAEHRAHERDANPRVR